MRRSHLVAVLAAAALAGGLAAPPARADGDPASDYLVGQKVFLPYDAKIPLADQQKLLATVQQANKQGFPIRVAVIWSDYDLGSITSLWNKPKLYARFLGAELDYYYAGRLLIVMPAGFGFNYPKHGIGSEMALLGKIPIASTPAGLSEAATTAVQRLAAADGVQLATTAPTSTRAQRNNHDRIVIAVAVVVALLLGGLFRLYVRRRAAARASG